MNPLDTQYADILRLIKRQGHEKDTRNGKLKAYLELLSDMT